ncbi:MAG: hypothetical protein GY940_10315, partial [bacterium]|nr:hypothetical protein [bacterium]
YTTGKNLIFYMNNTTKIGQAYIPTVQDTNWVIEGTGDFNKDGNIDILFRHYTTGRNLVYYMNNTTKIGQSDAPRVQDTNWHIVN